MDDPRKRPLLVGGITLDNWSDQLARALIDSGAWGMLGDILQIATDPNQPATSILGFLGGVIPWDFAMATIHASSALKEVVAWPPARQEEFRAGKRFLQTMVRMLPIVGQRLAEARPFRTGYAVYLEARRKALDAALEEDWLTFQAIQSYLEERGLPQVTLLDIREEAARREKRMRGLRTTPPRPGEPAWYEQRGWTGPKI
jgi:hypothetical protein